MRISYLTLVSGMLLAAGTGVAGAAISSAPSDLGALLTPVGAERAGNEAGTIPAWDGGLHPGNSPAHKPGDRPRDPFPTDQPLFVITRENSAQYRAQLSDGHQRLLAIHRDYQLPVYATRRTAAYPDEIYRATQLNTGRAKLAGSDTVTGAEIGFPFPVPVRGEHVIWNHKLKYRTDGVIRYNNEAIVEADGRYVMNRRLERAKFVYASIAQGAPLQRDILGYYQAKVLSPARSAGPIVLVHDTINPLTHPRKAWLYSPGQRRTRRAPSYGYDDPAPGTDGLAFVDQLDMFNGPLDRYEWKLIGKREMFIPYNAYRLSDDKLKYADILKPGHINQRHARYELHRVWVVEAQVKPGSMHAAAKRRFYVDEDSWTIVMVDMYDARDQYWRFQEGHPVVYYHRPLVTTIPEIVYDLSSRRYIITAMNNEDQAYQPAPYLTAADFWVNRIERIASP